MRYRLPLKLLQTSQQARPYQMGQLKRFLPAPVAFLLGIALVLALPPFSLPWVLPVVFGGLFHLTVRRPAVHAYLTGWVFGMGFFLFGISWIAESFFIEADQFGWMAVPAVAGLSAMLACFPALAVALFALTKVTGLSGVLVFSAFWSSAEWLRGTLLTGFPWNLIGYAWADYAIPRQVAALVGSYGVSLITVLSVTLPILILSRERHQKIASIVLFASLFALIWLSGTHRLALPSEASDTTLRIVQGNIPQHQKWDFEFRERNIARYMELSALPGRYDILLWPESAFPGYLEAEPAMLQQIAALLPNSAVLLTGVNTRQLGLQGEINRNSILAIDAEGSVFARYAKHHLVPFGEYVPWWSPLQVEQLTGGSSYFTPGPGPLTIQLPGSRKVGMSICYEAIFPGKIVSDHDRPDWIFNATNDAWFGTSFGPRQHFASARMRAVEEGLPLVRAANTGISAVIDSSGNIVARIGLEVTDVLDIDLPAPKPSTPFSQFDQLYFVLMLVGCLFAAALLHYRRKNRN
jgi:apolipoprotein N-acyltransferase